MPGSYAMSVILVSTLPQGRIDRVSERSLDNPGDLVVWPRQGVVAQDGRVVWVKGDSMLMLLAVAARPRHIIPNREMTELLWGDRPDGGPDRADQSLTAAWVMARAALIALGWHAERRMGRGFSAWPVERRSADAARFLERVA